MSNSKLKGSIILTEGRSGSNWLGSLTNKTGVLGKSEEWFARWAMPKGFKKGPMEVYIDHMIGLASSPNGYFCIKLFPAHLHYFNVLFGEDLIQILLERHDCNFVVLERSDTVKQAISFARSIQTEKWVSKYEAKREERYDPEMIARCYFVISRSYDFWKAMLEIREIKSTKFIYEDLVGKPNAYIECIARHAGVEVDEIPESPLKIQRDDKTDEWSEKFRADRATINLVAASTPQRPIRRDPSNVRRFMAGVATKPYPYSY